LRAAFPQYRSEIVATHSGDLAGRGRKLDDEGDRTGPGRSHQLDVADQLAAVGRDRARPSTGGQLDSVRAREPGLDHGIGQLVSQVGHDVHRQPQLLAGVELRRHRIGDDDDRSTGLDQ
jgi:hypothetical protein